MQTAERVHGRPRVAAPLAPPQPEAALFTDRTPSLRGTCRHLHPPPLPPPRTYLLRQLVELLAQSVHLALLHRLLSQGVVHAAGLPRAQGSGRRVEGIQASGAEQRCCGAKCNGAAQPRSDRNQQAWPARGS